VQRDSIELRPQQIEIWDQLERFSVLNLHRRFGKTILAICKLIHDVQECKHPNPRGHYFAPFLKQARNIAWDYLRIITSPMPGMAYNKSELTATFPSGAKIFLYGADNPDSFRGGYSDSVVLDEVAQMSPRIWGEVVRPALADRKGKALFIGTPFGKQNLFYELYERASDLPNWFNATRTADKTGVIDADELEQLRREMTVEEFDQELMCSWSAQVRGAYYGKEIAEAEDQARVGNVPYDESLPVHTAWDLGMADSTAIWFIQQVAGEVRAIDYVEYTGMGLPQIIKELHKKP
jgi:phage terminase large subunit